uniref:Uncharacterized protein n=1 Tax=Glossina austeni TaxID=7395 RepID=A0A1A9VUJ0_GLOAU
MPTYVHNSRKNATESNGNSNSKSKSKSNSGAIIHSDSIPRDFAAFRRGDNSGAQEERRHPFRTSARLRKLTTRGFVGSFHFSKHTSTGNLKLKKMLTAIIFYTIIISTTVWNVSVEILLDEYLLLDSEHKRHTYAFSS